MVILTQSSITQELQKTAYALPLPRMDLIMRGIRLANIITREGDSLDADWPMIDPSIGEYHPLFVDVVLSKTLDKTLIQNQ
ncbi:hypothetical protein ACN081_03900 [Rothia sp. P13129]